MSKEQRVSRQMARSGNFQFDLSRQFPNLPSAPIVEAVIHWQARAIKPWRQDTLAYALASKIPSYTKREPQRQLFFHAEFDALGAKSQVHRDSFLGLRLTSSDRLYIVQFNRDGLVVSRLKPYQDWDSFCAEGLRLWDVFVDVAEPPEVQRLGVRFINQISLATISDFTKVLAKPPKCLDTVGLPVSSYFYQSSHAVPQHHYGINVIQTIQPPTPPDNDDFRLILDIDAFTTESFESKSEILLEHLPKLRFLKDEAFFSLLKPKVIDSFKKERL